VKAHVETFGCTMNQGEGLMLQRRLASLGHEIVDSLEQAELVVVNTCAVIQTTENKVIRRLEQLRREGKRLVVAGCMAAVRSERIGASVPEAVIVPIQEYDRFPSIITEHFGGGGGGTPTGEPHCSAILPISQGCLGSCTYCITRLARGRLKSRPFEEIVASAELMLDSGVRELLITSQDTAAYGVDLGVRLPPLLSGLCSLEGEYRVRVGMMNPDSLGMILEDYVRSWQDERVYKFVHLPIQSGSDHMITRMGRRYTVPEFEDMVRSFRIVEQDMTLSTDVIVGFPGETEEDHRATVEMLERVRPNIVNITRFSPRPGTPAASFRPKVPGWVVKERSRELTRTRFRIAEELNSSFVGREMRALVVERGKGDTMVARTDCYKPVVLGKEATIGEFVTVLIEGSTGTHLQGSLANR